MKVEYKHILKELVMPRYFEISGYDEDFFKRYGYDQYFNWKDLPQTQKDEFVNLEKQMDALYEKNKYCVSEDDYIISCLPILEKIGGGIFADQGDRSHPALIRWVPKWNKGHRSGGDIVSYLSGRVFDRWYKEIKKAEADKKLIQEEENKKRQLEIERLNEEKYGFNKRNSHYRDSSLCFDKVTHTYTVNGRKLESVTTFIENLFPKFDSEYHAKIHAAKIGKTTQYVLDMWEKKGLESRKAGTEMHFYIERYLLGDSYTKRGKELDLFMDFYQHSNLKPYRTEWPIYDLETGFAGTLDYLDCNNGKFTLYDWKRSEKLIVHGLPAKQDPFGEKGYYPVSHLDNSPYYHYALQLSIYKYILEKSYSIKVDNLCLGIFHPIYDKPYILEIPYLP